MQIMGCWPVTCPCLVLVAVRCTFKMLGRSMGPACIRGRRIALKRLFDVVMVFKAGPCLLCFEMS